MHADYVIFVEGIMHMLIHYTYFESLDDKTLIRIIDICEGCSNPFNLTSQWFAKMLHHRLETGQGSSLAFFY